MAVDNKIREEQNLERYGVWVKAGPDAMSRHNNRSLDLMDIEDSDQDELLITEEEEKLLGELEESSLPDFDDFDEAYDDSFDEDFDEIPSGQSGESTEMLHKIEGEISLLRKEIRQLKDELTGLRLPSVSQADAESTEGGGFFDEEEDDETIALTGDELDNILDSADMTEESADEDTAGTEDMDFISDSDLMDEPEDLDTGFEEESDQTILFDDEETIDLSGDFTEISLEDDEEFDIDGIADETDPALAILGSPEGPSDSGDPETIEIDIPGLGETIDLDDSEPEDDSIVSIDDISGDDDFEEVTDLDDFGLDAGSTVEMPLVEEAVDLIQEPGDNFEEDDQEIADVFDEGEEVEIDLTDFDENLDSINESEILDVEMEDISLDDFGIAEDEDDVSDVLSDMVEASSDLAEDEFEQIDDINLESELADSIDDDDHSLISGQQDSESVVELEEFEDFELEDLVADDAHPVDEPDDLAAGEELLIDAIDLGTDVSDAALDIDEIDELEDLEEFDEFEEITEADGAEEMTLEIGPHVSVDEDGDISEMESLNEILLEEMDRPEESSDIDDIPEISLDEEIDDIESADEFSLEDDESIEDLEIEFEDDSEGVQVTLPDDDFNELPGTEEVDMDSLEALAAAPDLTEEEIEDFVELPDLDSEEPDTPQITSADIKEKARNALELSSLPGDLKDEIKDVLKYMDQLLESLPEEKIQEFARSEHFEVYKRIFEDLGISEDGSA